MVARSWSSPSADARSPPRRAAVGIPSSCSIASPMPTRPSCPARAARWCRGTASASTVRRSWLRHRSSRRQARVSSTGRGSKAASPCSSGWPEDARCLATGLPSSLRFAIRERSSACSTASTSHTHGCDSPGRRIREDGWRSAPAARVAQESASPGRAGQAVRSTFSGSRPASPRRCSSPTDAAPASSASTSSGLPRAPACRSRRWRRRRRRHPSSGRRIGGCRGARRPRCRHRLGRAQRARFHPGGWRRVAGARAESASDGHDGALRPRLSRRAFGPPSPRLRRRSAAAAPAKAARAHAIVHAPGAAVVTHELEFPEWCRDLPRPGTRFSSGDPVCTVHASAPDAAAAVTLVRRRQAATLAVLQEAAA